MDCRVWLSVVGVVVAAAGCPPPTQTPGETDRRSFTTNLTDEMILPSLTQFAAQTAALRDAPDREARREAWLAAMSTWQQLEMLHVGPAGAPNEFTAGEGLRARIYAWPVVNLCAVDQQIVADEFEEEGWIDVRLPNVIGLAALEYVLFVDDDGNQCPPDSSLNTGGSWAALDSDEIAARRARYAAVVAAGVAAQAQALLDLWETSFAAALRTAGEPGSPFPTAQQALDEIYGALFAIDTFTKDKRLAIPAGLNADCAATACPEKAESRFSRTSKENILANLQMTRRVFLGIDREGADDTGFDDLLRERGADDVVTSMTTGIDGAIAAVTAFEGTLEDALVTEPARVHALYDAVKVFTDDFKSTFQSALGLRIPGESDGDND